MKKDSKGVWTAKKKFVRNALNNAEKPNAMQSLVKIAQTNVIHVKNSFVKIVYMNA